MEKDFYNLCEEIRECNKCSDYLPFKPNPVFQLSPKARILIVGQAPGVRVHLSGIPFNDPSGDRLRQWLGVSREEFYDSEKFAILPMGLCYPGANPKGGDRPPCPNCAALWHPQVLPYLTEVHLKLLVGQYAQAYYLQGRRKQNLTETVKAWKEYLPELLPLPHPSWRSQGWMKRNPWFEKEIIPYLQKLVRNNLSDIRK